MSYALVVEPSATRDIAEAYAYYAQHGRGDASLAAVDHVFAQLGELPLMYPVVFAGFAVRYFRALPIQYSS